MSRSARRNPHANLSTSIPRVAEQEFYQQVESYAGTPLILLLDEVSDPHNLGACLRSANAAGAMAVLTPKHHSARVTDTVIRVSCGAAEDTPVVAVANLARAMTVLQDLGLLLLGTDDSASESLHNSDLTGPIGLVLGAEGTGLRRLTKAKCDSLIHIPMRGSVPCLNVSVAAGICLFEALRQRHG